MKFIRWKDDLINIEGLRSVEYSNTNSKAKLYFQNESRVIEIWVNDRDLNEFYSRINKANEKSA